MEVLVDSSAWISFFRGTEGEEDVAKAVDYLLSGDECATNEVIKTEIMPMITLRNEDASLLEALRCSELIVDWSAVRELQVKCLRAGINKVGIGDLIIALDAVRLKRPLFTLDKHFRLIAKVLPQLTLWPM